MRVRAGLGVLALAAAAASAAPAVAGPTRSPTLEVLVIHATRTDAGTSIDPQLRDLPHLSKQEPFARYNVYRLVERQQFSLEAGRPVTYALVNGRTLQLTLDSVTQPAPGSWRYQLETQIAEAGKDAFLKGLQVTAGANQPFFVGGQSYQGGTLFLELVIRP